MIYVDVISSSDSLALGLYEFEYDHILIGRSKKNDLIFLDKELPMNYMILEIIEDHSGHILMVRSLTRTPFFFINEKKVSGALKVRINDIITLGEHKIKIIHFKKTKIEEDLTEAFDNFSKTAPELRFALDFIEEVLIDLEVKADNV